MTFLELENSASEATHLTPATAVYKML